MIALLFKKKKMNLSKQQNEIIQWLLHHRQETAYSTWQLLFGERDGKYPDRCIAYYDELSTKEKSDVELIIARYYALLFQNKNKLKIKDLAYEESI